MTKYQVSKFKRQQALRLRHASTEAELVLWRALRSRQLEHIKFRRQVPVGPWIVDFVSFELMLVIEADGGQHMSSDSDRKRDADLMFRGFRVLRFWNNDILNNKDGVLQRIIEFISDTSHPAAYGRDPLPQGERVR